MVKKITDLVFTGDSDGIIMDGVHVGLSPHYRYALGDTQDYIAWHKIRGKDLRLKLAKFDALISSAKTKGIRNPIKVRGNMIVDGHHRAAVALALGCKEIECLEL